MPRKRWDARTKTDGRGEEGEGEKKPRKNEMTGAGRVRGVEKKSPRSCGERGRTQTTASRGRETEDRKDLMRMETEILPNHGDVRLDSEELPKVLNCGRREGAA